MWDTDAMGKDNAAGGKDDVPSPGVSASVPPAVMALRLGTMLLSAWHGGSLGSGEPEPDATRCRSPLEHSQQICALEKAEELERR